MMPQRASRRRILSMRACIVNLLRVCADDRGRWGGGGDPGAPARAPTADADLTERRKRRPRRSRRGRPRLPTCARARTSQALRGRREPGAAHRRALEARPVARRAAPTPSGVREDLLRRWQISVTRLPLDNSLDVAELLE